MALDVECVVDRGMSGEKQAYRRGDALEKPRKLMEARANYCEPKGLGNVVQIGKRRSM